MVKIGMFKNVRVRLLTNTTPSIGYGACEGLFEGARKNPQNLIGINQKMSILNKFISKKNQHTYGLLLRIIGSLMWVYITAPIGAFVVILGELVTWIDFDE